MAHRTGPEQPAGKAPTSRPEPFNAQVATVEVDHQPVGQHHERPGPAQDLGQHTVELAQVAEGEPPQERAQGRGRHHRVAEDPSGRSCPQQIDVVDVSGAGRHGVDQGEHLAPWQGAPAR